MPEVDEQFYGFFDYFFFTTYEVPECNAVIESAYQAWLNETDDQQKILIEINAMKKYMDGLNLTKDQRKTVAKNIIERLLVSGKAFERGPENYLKICTAIRGNVDDQMPVNLETIIEAYDGYFGDEMEKFMTQIKTTYNGTPHLLAGQQITWRTIYDMYSGKMAFYKIEKDVVAAFLDNLLGCAKEKYVFVYHQPRESTTVQEPELTTTWKKQLVTGKNAEKFADGFYHFHNPNYDTLINMEPATERVYINPNSNAAKTKIMKFVLDAFGQDKNIKKAKVAGPGRGRVDGIVILMSDSMAADNLASVIAKKFSKQVDDGLPAIVRRVSNGVGRCSEPPKIALPYFGSNTSHSFGSFWSKLIFACLLETRWRAEDRFMEQFHGSEMSFKQFVNDEDQKIYDWKNFRTLLQYKMEKLGIDPKTPSTFDYLGNAEKENWNNNQNLPKLYSIDLSNDDLSTEEIQSSIRKMKEFIAHLSSRISALESISNNKTYYPTNKKPVCSPNNNDHGRMMKKPGRAVVISRRKQLQKKQTSDESSVIWV